MLNALIRFSLAQRPLVLASAVVLLVLGGRQAMRLPVDVLPDLTRPTVTLLTEAPGYAAEEVETLVTTPLENTLMGVSGVTRLRSVNDVSLSLIFIEFDWDTDIYKARQFVQERLSGAGEVLPDGLTPYMTPVTSLMGDIMLVGLRDPSGMRSPQDLRSLADWVVARRLRSIPGVAEVLAMGGGIRQIQVQPDPERMLMFGVSFEQVREAAAEAVRNTTGGFMTEQSREIMVRNLAMTSDLDALADTVVDYQSDRPIRLGDVATLTWDVAPMRGDAGMGTSASDTDVNAATGGDRGVILSVRKSPGFDTLALTQVVEDALDELQQSLPEGTELIQLYRQAGFIDLAIGNLEEALRDGAIMVAIVIFLFLLNVRVTFITLTAIPLSLAITILVFHLMHIGVNSMTLGGLAVAIGMVVDDAIVDVENVFRRLRENARLEAPIKSLEVIARASSEVRSSIFYATVLIILVFVPLLALSGVEGRLFTPIAIATIVSMAASFLVSLTVIPVLSSFLLTQPSKGEHSESHFAARTKAFFRGTWLRLALDQPAVVGVITVALLLVSGVAYTQMGGNFLPPFREPTVLVAMTAAPGTSLKTTTGLADTALDRLLEIPGVSRASYRAGRAERGDHVVPVSSVEFDVEFDASLSRPRDEVVGEIRTAMQGIPGTFSALSGPLADRVGHMLSGVSAKVAVKVYGPELETLRQLGAEIADVARGIPGLEEARMEQQAPIPQLRIEIDRQRALAYGVTPGDLNTELASLIGGTSVAQVYEGIRAYDLVVRLPLEWRENPERLKNIYIDTESGQRVPLSYVAQIRQAAGPNTIMRENARRRFVVSINPTTSDLNGAVEALQEAVAEEIKLPEGYSIAYEGEYQAQQEARRIILVSSTVVLLVIIFLLYSYFQSLSLALVVLSSLPVAMVGAVLYTRFALNTVSIATLVGLVAIAGIAARNNIMLVSHYLHLMRHEGEGFTRAMVERGTLERVVPVLMTALSAGIALVPLVLAADAPGKEILTPVAVVVIGGLISSTALGLAVTPALFHRFCRNAAAHSLAVRSAASGSY